NLIKSVNFQYLKNLNIIFLTHSPLILSDIISNNVLYLNKVGKREEKVSFAANIVNLYADSFFIGDYLIGDYARNKINETIEWLNDLKNKKIRIEELDKIKKLNSIQIAEKNQITESIKKLSAFSKDHLQLIKIIDEPIIKNKLLE